MLTVSRCLGAVRGQGGPKLSFEPFHSQGKLLGKSMRRSSGHQFAFGDVSLKEPSHQASFSWAERLCFVRRSQAPSVGPRRLEAVTAAHCGRLLLLQTQHTAALLCPRWGYWCLWACFKALTGWQDWLSIEGPASAQEHGWSCAGCHQLKAKALSLASQARRPSHCVWGGMRGMRGGLLIH